MQPQWTVWTSRLRHVSALSTARYSRHVRYLAELQKVSGTADECGTLQTSGLASVLSAQGELAWQRMIVGWIASRLVRGLFIVFPSTDIWRAQFVADLAVRPASSVSLFSGGASRSFTSVCKRGTFSGGDWLQQVVGLDIWTFEKSVRARTGAEQSTASSASEAVSRS